MNKCILKHCFYQYSLFIIFCCKICLMTNLNIKKRKDTYINAFFLSVSFSIHNLKSLMVCQLPIDFI